MWKSEDRWEVAAFHPGQGYGGISAFETPKKALEERDRMLSRGAKNVHVRHVRVEVLAHTMTSIKAEKKSRSEEDRCERKTS